jgi:hypothetical protein
VAGAERAWLERHDVETELADWAPDAVQTSARSRVPGPYDVQLTRAQVASIRPIVAEREPLHRVTLTQVRVEINGDVATLQCKLTTEHADAIDTFGNVFTLRRNGGSWQISHKRYWPLGRSTPSESAQFPEGWYEDGDTEVESLRKLGDNRQLAWTLFGVYRFREALEVSRALTAEPDALPWDWEMRGTSALMLGLADEAKLSYERKRELESSIDLP